MCLRDGPVNRVRYLSRSGIILGPKRQIAPSQEGFLEDIRDYEGPYLGASHQGRVLADHLQEGVRGEYRDNHDWDAEDNHDVGENARQATLPDHEYHRIYYAEGKNR